MKENLRITELFLQFSVLRIMIGEPLIGLPPLFNVYLNEKQSQNLIFPVKTTLMLVSLITLISTSWLWTKFRRWKDDRNNPQYIICNGEIKQYS